jgi:CelD/BcsL family acetyltransferase involved in cellulose biosynthesis
MARLFLILCDVSKPHVDFITWGWGRAASRRQWYCCRMPQYETPNFLDLPVGLAAVFSRFPRTSFFDLPQWYDLMARFGVPNGTEIRVFTDERPGSSVAIPLQIMSEHKRRCLTSLANFYSVEHGVVAAPGADLEKAFAAILSEIQESRPRLDCLRFLEFDPRDSSYHALRRALRNAGFLVECGFASGTWFEETASLSFSDYFAHRPSELRNTWRRKRHSIDRSRRLRAAFFPGSISIAGAISDYQITYAASWKAAEPYPHFMPALMELAAELGALRLGIYYLDGLPAAAQFWIVWDGRAIIYKLAHDKRFDSLSLGTILTMEMIERVLESDHPREINFGRGDDAYKRLWLSRRRERWNINAFNSRTLPGIALGLEREVAKLVHWARGQPRLPPGHPMSS